MSFNWAPVISRDIAFAKLAGRTPTAIAMHPDILDDLMTRKPKVYLIDFDPEIDEVTFDGVPVLLDRRVESYRLL